MRKQQYEALVTMTTQANVQASNKIVPSVALFGKFTYSYSFSGAPEFNYGF
jgi:hypothetical protein